MAIGRPRRSVLFLAFHYPPIGGAGVQRNVQLVRGLPDRGYRPIVVTGPGAPDYRWTPPDSSLEPARGIATHRLSGVEPPHGGAWEGRAERWLRLAPRWQRWWRSRSVELAAALDEEVDLVRASLGPYGVAGAALEVARLLRRPLVLDLEDPWALDEMMVYPSEAHRRLELRRMRRFLASADAVVMNTAEAARRLVETFPELAARIVRAVPNAFDPADFDRAPPARREGRFRIVHTGSMHTDLGFRQRSASGVRRKLGGQVDGVDFLPRSHVFLVDALRRLLERRAELAGRVEVHFAGSLTELERDMLGALPCVRLHGFLPHGETIDLIRSADVLFLPMHALPPGRRATIVPHKTYEYVASGRPIVAAVPDGDARDLLEAAGTARLCRPADADGIAAALDAEIDRWIRGDDPPAPRSDVLAACAAPRLVRDLSLVFDEILAASSPASPAGSPGGPARDRGGRGQLGS